MLWVRKLLLVLICLPLAFHQPMPAVASDRDDTWIIQIKIVRDQLPKLHKNLFFKITSDQWQKGFDTLIENVPNLKDNEIRVELMRLVAMVGDGHTQTWYKGDFSMYPFDFKWFKDGIYCESTTVNQKEAFCRKLVAVEGMPIEKVIEKMTPYLSHDNIYGLKTSILFWITDADFLEAIGLVKDRKDAKYTFEDSKGKQVTVSARAYASYGAVPWDKDADYQEKVRSHTPIYRIHGQGNWARYFPDTKLLFFRYDYCDSYGMSDMIDWMQKKVFAKYDVKKFAIDFRNNGGGSSSALEPMIDWISKQSINKADKLFILTDKPTYSSAVLNVLQFKQRTQATSVGEPTGSKPNHYGEVRRFELETAKMVVTYSTKYFSWWPEDTDAYHPDDLIETSSTDYFNAVDPVMDAIMNETVKIPEFKPPPKPVLTREQRWAKDLEELTHKLNEESSYIDVTSAQIEKRINELKAQIPNLSDIQLKLEIQKLLALSNQPELQVVLDPVKISLRFVALPDGIFAIQSLESNKNVLGKKLVRLGKNKVNVDLMMKFKALFPCDNINQLTTRFADYLVCPEILTFLGLVDDPNAIELEFEDASGCSETITVKAEALDETKAISAAPFDKKGTTPLYRSKSNNYWFTYLKVTDTLYARFSKTEEDSTLFSLFSEKFDETYRASNTKRIVLDLRGNEGGNPSLADDFVRKIVIKSNAMRLPVFVLVDRYTQGSAVYEACLLRNLCKARIVGENTGTKPNHTGNPKLVEMENGSLQIKLPSQAYNFDPSDSIMTLAPDMPITFDSLSFFNSEDLFLNRAVRLK